MLFRLRQADPPVFDAARAFVDLERQVKFGPRVPGTDGHTACRDWLLAELKKSCGEASRQDFRVRLPAVRGGATIYLNLANIYARLGPDTKDPVLLCAHWDTRPTADMEEDPKNQKKPIPGANDGASGVAVLLELARLFAVQPPAVGVQFVLFDGEDYGPEEDRMYLGARQYARYPTLPAPRFAVLVDMVGKKDLVIPREIHSEMVAREINDKIWKAAADLKVKQFVEKKGHTYNADDLPFPIDDDHLPLHGRGWKAVDLIDFAYPEWHTLRDTPDKCSPESLKAVGDVLAKVVYDEKPSQT